MTAAARGTRDRAQAIAAARIARRAVVRQVDFGELVSAKNGTIALEPKTVVIDD